MRMFSHLCGSFYNMKYKVLDVSSQLSCKNEIKVFRFSKEPLQNLLGSVSNTSVPDADVAG